MECGNPVFVCGYNVYAFLFECWKFGQVENEVQKLKYGSETKSRLLVFSALLTHGCVY